VFGNIASLQENGDNCRDDVMMLLDLPSSCTLHWAWMCLDWRKLSAMCRSREVVVEPGCLWLCFGVVVFDLVSIVTDVCSSHWWRGADTVADYTYPDVHCLPYAQEG